jgi:hypothetical protein
VPCPENDEVKAIVTGFSKSGEIVFATNEQYGTITFKLSLDVWSEQGSPALKQIVVLSGITKFQRGWRAATARQFTLADDSNETA